MATEHLIFLSIPGLRASDISAASTPTLYSWANRGSIAELAPTFPCVTSCVQASMLTGLAPGKHGVIANGFYDRDRQEVAFWVGRDEVVEGERIWSAIRARRPAYTSAVWHAQNIRGASADFIVTPAPIHEADGTTRLWCYSRPEGLYQHLLGALGHFPLQHYWGPMSNIESTRWILRAAERLIERHAPNFHWVYLPHLDYAAQKFGPNSRQASAAVGELDRELAWFAERVASTAFGKGTIILVAGEYAMTEARGAIFPNRILRNAGLLAVREEDGREDLDLQRSAAFAMVDHQFAHVFVRQEGREARKHGGSTIDAVVELFRNIEGISGVYAGAEQEAIGMTHERCGDAILVCDDAHWLAYYWWFDDRAAPPFARTVDIHRKPGYDPVELFFDPATKGIPLDASLVRGSHGVPATGPQHRTALVCSERDGTVVSGRTYRDADMKALCLKLLGL